MFKYKTPAIPPRWNSNKVFRFDYAVSIVVTIQVLIYICDLRIYVVFIINLPSDFRTLINSLIKNVHLFYISNGGKR